MNNPHFKAIFFDNDGLLVDTETLWLEACREALAPLGVTISNELYTVEVLGKGRALVRDLAREQGLSEDEIKALQSHRNNLYGEKLRKNVELLDGVKETLEKLQGKFVMGIVTTSSREHLDIILDKTGLRKFFNFFITFEDVTHPKPDPEPYLKAVELSGMPKANCLVLEDSLRGVQAAKAAGLACYAIPEGWTRTHDFSTADKVLGNISEVANLL